MERQTIPCEYAGRADLGAIGWVTGNSNRLQIQVILDPIHQSLDAFIQTTDDWPRRGSGAATHLLSRFDQQNKTMVNSRQTMARQDLHNPPTTIVSDPNPATP